MVIGEHQFRFESTPGPFLISLLKALRLLALVLNKKLAKGLQMFLPTHLGLTWIQKRSSLAYVF